MSFDFRTAFAPLLPALIEDYRTSYRATAERMIQLGKERGRDVFKIRGWDEVRYMVTGRVHEGLGEVNQQVIDQYAEQAGEDAFNAMLEKLARKVGMLDRVEVIRSGTALEFTIQGHLGDRLVRVEQRRIMNMTTHGKLFHQWPALIYVDGKRVTEAGFKKLAAGEV